MPERSKETKKLPRRLPPALIAASRDTGREIKSALLPKLLETAGGRLQDDKRNMDRPSREEEEKTTKIPGQDEGSKPEKEESQEKEEQAR